MAILRYSMCTLGALLAVVAMNVTANKIPWWNIKMAQEQGTPERDSNLNLPVIGSLVYCESSGLDYAATESDLFSAGHCTEHLYQPSRSITRPCTLLQAGSLVPGSNPVRIIVGYLEDNSTWVNCHSRGRERGRWVARSGGWGFNPENSPLAAPVLITPTSSHANQAAAMNPLKRRHSGGESGHYSWGEGGTSEPRAGGVTVTSRRPPGTLWRQ
uniref:Uncharacterized protein n=1 Tax=Timema bartmani TaxID=61472 RepID=A0A7R9EU34_9NEOP|nr:unnamed protein product [Timema bartmani]